MTTLTRWAIVVTVAFFIVIAIDLMGGSSGPLDDGATVDGRITSVDATPGNSACSVTAAFQVDGQTYVATTPDSTSGLCGFEVGATVSVSYQPNDPTNNRIVTSREGDRTWMFLMPVGLLAVVTTVAAVHQTRRRQKQRSGSPIKLADHRQSLEPPITSRTGFSGSMFKDPASVTTASEQQKREHLPRPAPHDDPVAAPPGWYPDHDGQSYRWWDGRTWTEHQWAGDTTSLGAGDQGGDGE